MKRLLLILILTLSFQSWIKADDIRDFEVEGISIGDSLLKLFSKKEIESNMAPYVFKSDTFKLFETDQNFLSQSNFFLVIIKVLN